MNQKPVNPEQASSGAGENLPPKDTIPRADRTLVSSDSQPSILQNPPNPGEVLFGRYVVQSEIGRGGMGTVWLVNHLTLKTPRALKLIIPTGVFDSVARERFRREATTMASLEHPNAGEVHDAQIGANAAYIDMEYVRGSSLDRRLQPGVPCPLDWVTSLLTQLCDVLQAAHSLGIVHRDLKPSNLMLVEGHEPGKEILKVLDFGIAKLLEHGHDDESVETMTAQGEFRGTPHYASPEQCLSDSEKIREASDIYSVGIILYQLLTGYRPFQGGAREQISAHLNTPPPPFAVCNPNANVPPAVEKVVLRCLAKDPDARPQSARALKDEFLRAVNESSTPATRDANEESSLILEAYVDESADAEEVSAALANLGYTLNAYHIAAGGNGLIIDDIQVLVPDPEFLGADEP